MHEASGRVQTSAQRVCDLRTNLGVGSYSIVTALMAHASNVDSRFEWKDRALMFEVVNRSKTEFIGCLWMEPRIEIGAK